MPWHEPFRQLQIHEKKITNEFHSFKTKIIAALVIIALGCAWGLYQVNSLSKGRHDDSCWSSYNNSVVLRALINESIAASPKKQQHNAKRFVQQSFKIIPLQHCGGSNPNPPSSKVLKLAGVKHKH